MAAFQLNVFRACGLMVIVMGADAKISYLMERMTQSYSGELEWMSLIPRFPSYEILLSTKEERRIRPELVAKYPIVQAIVTHYRGRFARYFMEAVVECMTQSSSMDLCGMLDDAFALVSRKTNQGKEFLSSPEKKYAQLMAISLTGAAACSPNEAVEPPGKKAKTEPLGKKNRLQVGTSDMHSHFANLMDDELKDMRAHGNILRTERHTFRPQRGGYLTTRNDVLSSLQLGIESGCSS